MNKVLTEPMNESCVMGNDWFGLFV